MNSEQVNFTYELMNFTMVVLNCWILIISRANLSMDVDENETKRKQLIGAFQLISFV